MKGKGVNTVFPPKGCKDCPHLDGFAQVRGKKVLRVFCTAQGASDAGWLPNTHGDYTHCAHHRNYLRAIAEVH